ncbi:MAG: hypothetical protein QOK88_07530 [Nitrososphaeraceae archaeon]|nr:hypothetical protein [Nitrososphaeraceae archaeon]
MEELRVRSVYFLILSFSIILVASAGILNTYMNKSWADTPLTLDNILKNYYVKIQDKSQNDLEVSSDLSEDSEAGNETGSDLTGQALSSEENSEDNNQTSTQTTGESESNQNINQTTVTQQQTQNNQTVNIQNNIEMKQKLEIAISEEEGEAPISVEEQTRIESSDSDIVTQHKALTGPDCRTGNVLAGASNAEDLRVLTECQDATGTVMHTKKMDDGDYKFFLNLDDQFKFLTNEKNNEKTDGFLVVEIVPPDQGNGGVILPKEGDHVHIWGAWVTDKPKGWHEIHPTWKVVNE